MYLLRAAGSQPVRYTDDFNRTAGAIGNGWVSLGGNALTTNGTALGASVVQPTTIFNTYVWPSAVATADQSVEITVSQLGVEASWGGTAIIIGFLRSDATLTNGAAISIERTSSASVVCKIYTPTAYNTFGTARMTSAALSSVVAGDVFKLEASGNVYTPYRNNVVIPSTAWTDSGNVVNIANRRVGLGIQAAAPTFNQQAQAFMDNWIGRDTAA